MGHDGRSHEAACEFRFYPDDAQTAEPSRTFGCVREDITSSPGPGARRARLRRRSVRSARR
ncbi:helix-turn-helix domain-containing protein [Kitasatospora sp. DSM 101779]|uniref:helix-turn-helix domain-containing protein n=1 Tax=Kitasatospora sp. DSM 101779 TaxID=2853165 RepID=UPI0021D8EDC2|nr:helix-turn-helix domain-containing protein [Kitasatospora sp. DSM 101779]MCU7827147.1 helix-turn-helix domain-containing protein [Kitasatospora sp. DSM 101779]